MVWIGHISVSLRFKKWIKTFYKYVCVCSRSLFICLLPQKRLMWLICLFLVHPKWQNVFLLDLWFLDLDLFSLQENRINIQKSIQTLSLLHIWLCCSLTLKWFKYIFPSSICMICSSAASCLSRWSLRCFSTLTWVHLWLIRLIGHDLERHTSVYLPAMRSKELPADLSDRILRKATKKKSSAAFKVTESKAASMILNWKKFEATTTLPKANWAIRGEGPW